MPLQETHGHKFVEFYFSRIIFLYATSCEAL